jgi:acyl carrier protein
MLGLAAGRFAAAIGQIAQRPLRARVYSPVAQRFVNDDLDLKQLLVRQLTAQVDFLGALRALHEAGVQHFVEGIPSGLAALVKRSVPGATPAPGLHREAGDEEAPRLVSRSETASETASAATRAEVLEQLRGLYASTLGYPPEAITADADLEADLGIDSLKRAEMLAKVTVHFQLKDADDGRYASHQTLAELAELVMASTDP